MPDNDSTQCEAVRDVVPPERLYEAAEEMRAAKLAYSMAEKRYNDARKRWVEVREQTSQWIANEEAALDDVQKAAY